MHMWDVLYLGFTLPHEAMNARIRFLSIRHKPRFQAQQLYRWCNGYVTPRDPVTENRSFAQHNTTASCDPVAILARCWEGLLKWRYIDKWRHIKRDKMASQVRRSRVRSSLFCDYCRYYIRITVTCAIFKSYRPAYLISCACIAIGCPCEGVWWWCVSTPDYIHPTAPSPQKISEMGIEK